MPSPAPKSLLARTVARILGKGETEPEGPVSERVGRIDEFQPGKGRRFRVGGKDVAVFLLPDGNWKAVDANCPHRGGPLDEGDVSGCRVACPWHGWEFDLNTGKSPDQPAQVFCHDVRIEDGSVVVTVRK